MRKLGFCFFVLLFCFFGFTQAQIRRIIKNPTSKTEAEIWKPNKEGCRPKYAVGYKRPKPKDVLSLINYAYNGVLGRNSIIAVEYSCAPKIESVNLNKTELAICSQSIALLNDACPDKLRYVEISVDATDPDGDILLYQYDVTGGKIIGSGSKVVWDLSEVKPGTYTVKVLVDDGCGVCIEPLAREIKISECEKCQ